MSSTVLQPPLHLPTGPTLFLNVFPSHGLSPSNGKKAISDEIPVGWVEEGKPTIIPC